MSHSQGAFIASSLEAKNSLLWVCACVWICMCLCMLHRALNLTLFICLVPAGPHNTNYLGKWLMFVLKPTCRWNVCYNFPFFNLSPGNSWLLPCTGDCEKLYQRKYLDTYKFKSQLHDGKVFYFIQLFVFKNFPIWFDCVYVNQSERDLSESWQVDAKGPWKCNQVKRWIKSAQTLKRDWWKR